jgi:hypothetical protein
MRDFSHGPYVPASAEHDGSIIGQQNSLWAVVPLTARSAIQVVLRNLRLIAALFDNVKSTALLRCCHQLAEIGTPMSNGFRGQGLASQDNTARIDAARTQRCHGIAHLAVAAKVNPQAVDQADLAAYPDDPWQWLDQPPSKTEDAGTVPAQQQV